VDEQDDDQLQLDLVETASAAAVTVGDPVVSIMLKNGEEVGVFEDYLSIHLGQLSRELLDGCGDGLYEAPDGRCRDVNECQRGVDSKYMIQ